MRICLFEDAGVRCLEPLSLTRPVFELVCGRTSLRAKLQRHTAAGDVGVLIRWHLTDLFRLQEPDAAVNDLNWLHADDTLFVNGRWLPPPGRLDPLDGHGVGLIGDEVAFAYVPRGLMSACHADEISSCLARWKAALPPSRAGGKMVRYPWDLVANNAEQLRHDFDADGGGRPSPDLADRRGSPDPADRRGSPDPADADRRGSPDPADRRGSPDPADADRRGSPDPAHQEKPPPEEIALRGPKERFAVAADAQVEPFVAVDTTDGPVVIDRQALVTSFSRLEGPCYIGPNTHVMGAKIRGGTTIGPNCRIGGEVEASIVHAYSNKYHDGFLGHAYIGEWVNLGAGTHNSDLRNDYGVISVPMRHSRVNTGLDKVGCFIGDHTKTGLGTLINTGSNIGAFANLLPAGMLAPKYVPSFTSLWKGELQENRDFDRLLAIAKKVMARRGVDLTKEHAALYRHLFEEERSIEVLQKPKVSRSA